MGAKNWVLEGDYKHKAVIMQGGKAVLNVGLMKNLKLDSSTIDQIEVVDEDSQKSMGSAVARGAAGALLLGPLGVVAAAPGKPMGVLVVASQSKAGTRALLELADTGFTAIKLAMF